MNTEVVILAAGKGSRMMSSLPKVLHRIAGRELLKHVLDTADSLSIQKKIVVVGYKKELIKEKINNDELNWVEQKELKGTSDAVAQGIPFLSINSRVLILYGDVPFVKPLTLQKFIDSTPEKAIGFITTVMPNPYGLGRVVRDQHLCVQKIVEEKEANEQEKAIKEVNSGIMLLPSSVLREGLKYINNINQQKEYYLTSIIEWAINSKIPVSTYLADDHNEVLGINDQLQLMQADLYYQREKSKELLDKGYRISDINRFSLRAKVDCKEGAFFDVDTVLEGSITSGTNLKVGPFCVLKDCVFGDNVTILSHCCLEGVIVEDNVTIGPFARIRPNTILKNSSKVGNFVEIKNTVLGAGAKANHLSYLGDSIIEEKVNIGAGTITCNYDGINKNKTIIKKGAFIGSNSSLIAPVVIEEDAIIGAGTTLLQDAPAGQVTINKKKQHSFEKEKTVLSKVDS